MATSTCKLEMGDMEFSMLVPKREQVHLNSMERDLSGEQSTEVGPTYLDATAFLSILIAEPTRSTICKTSASGLSKRISEKQLATRTQPL